MRPARHPHNSSLPPPIERQVLPAHGDPESAHIQRMIEPIELSVSAREPERVNVLIPTVDLKHLFGGYIAKFNLARKLAEGGPPRAARRRRSDAAAAARTGASRSSPTAA